MIRFAVLQLSGCAGCEVSLLHTGDWLQKHQLVYMPLVVSAYDVPHRSHRSATASARGHQSDA
jgi:coenzyme F420-reducing hydrogenase gamma subunit